MSFLSEWECGGILDGDDGGFRGRGCGRGGEGWFGKLIGGRYSGS